MVHAVCTYTELFSELLLELAVLKTQIECDEFVHEGLVLETHQILARVVTTGSLLAVASCLFCHLFSFSCK